MQIELSFGRQGLLVELPEKAIPQIIRKPKYPVPEDPHALVKQALSQPISSKKLSREAMGNKTACILVCDITRPVPNKLFLKPVIAELEAGGIQRDSITILIATGLHRPNLGEELEEVIGDPWVTENIRILNHDARDESSIVHLGKTPTHQVPLGLNRHFVEADLKLVTGLVEPHFMAGYSGGRKVIAPGIAHHETIRTFHSARFMESPYAASCNLDNNPLHESQLEIVQMLGGEILAVNTILDEERNLIHVNFGEVLASHQEAVNFARASCEIPVGRKFKTILTSSAGYPLDKTYYQTVKGMVTPLDILEPGGTLIIASECAEGIGSPEFRESQARLVELGPAAFLETLLSKDLAEIDEWESEMQLKPMRVGEVQLYCPGMSEEDQKLTGVKMIADLQEAVAEAIERVGDAEVAVIPEGPYLVPFASA
ncbi:MAG: nickel-dependent lactate racemase [Deltaproteobacteria bacterium]